MPTALNGRRYLEYEKAIDLVELFAAGQIKPPADYFYSHAKRYVATLCSIPFAEGPGKSAIEFGASHLFQWALKTVFGYEHVHGTYFGGDAGRAFDQMVEAPDYYKPHKGFFINLEDDVMPIADETYDFGLCCEVIEHMDCDPMFFLAEVNRITKTGGTLLMTTPNSTSARNIIKILRGRAPHQFMSYTRDRDRYRHNIEYDVHQVGVLGQAAGFDIEGLRTLDTWAETPPEVIEFLRKNGFPTEARGDNTFFFGRKAGPVRDRYPGEGIYVGEGSHA